MTTETTVATATPKAVPPKAAKAPAKRAPAVKAPKTKAAMKKPAAKLPVKAAPKKAEPKAEAPKATGKTAVTEDIAVVRKFLLMCIERKYGTMTGYAEKKGKSLQYVSSVMKGVKAIPAWMYKDFKINHIVEERWEATV